MPLPNEKKKLNWCSKGNIRVFKNQGVCRQWASACLGATNVIFAVCNKLEYFVPAWWSSDFYEIPHLNF